MARINLGGLSTLRLDTQLDPMFTELYGIADFFATPTYTGTSWKVKIDSNGNVALNGTPSAWNASWRAVDAYPGGGSLASSLAITSLANNAYFDSGAAWRYKGAYGASMIQQTSGGAVAISVAAPGAAGAVITWVNAMTLDSSGNLICGASAAAGVGGITLQAGANGYAHVNNNNAASSGFVFQSMRRSGTEIGSITQNGTTGVLFNTSSDARLKENIADAADSGALLDAVRVRQFDWRADGSHQRFGFVAQELVQVVPEAVHQPEDADEMMAVDYSKLVPLLVKEVQSLRARVAELEAKA